VLYEDDRIKQAAIFFKVGEDTFENGKNIIGCVWMVPALTLPKMVSQLFGVEFDCQGLTKKLATVCEGNTNQSIGSQNHRNKPNMCR
jgi:hypothetical protein